MAEQTGVDAAQAYARYGPALARKAERVLGHYQDACDVVQSLFVELMQKSTQTYELAYLYRAVTNRCLNILRDSRNRARLLAQMAEHGEEWVSRSDTELAITRELVLELAARLDEQHMEVVIARYVDDMSLEEIAEQISASRKTVSRRLLSIRAVVQAMRDETKKAGTLHD